MDTKISILFYGKLSRSTINNLLPIYLRVTINGKRFETSTQRYIEPSRWSKSSGRVKGNNEEARTINIYLDNLRSKIYHSQNQLIQQGKPVTVESIKLIWLGKEDESKMLLKVFQEHNDHLKQLVGKSYAPATLKRYKTSIDHTRAFIQWKFQRNDIDIKKLTYEFITDFDFWFRTVRNCNHNSTIKYVSNLRKIINICVKNGWIPKDPFFGFKMNKKEVVRDFLAESELQTIVSHDFKIERLNHVRDLFVFACFTGLAYVDIKKLKRSEVNIGVDGEKWIFTNRQKTDGASRIPLLAIPLTLIEKYRNHPLCLNKDLLLPVPSNQKLNAYLKEIADVCGISKTLTFHIARHTFATTVTLGNGVPIESVSKMLGHKNLRITQHYAKILDMKVSNDMKVLREKFRMK